MIITDTDTDTRHAATNGLAVVGFIALIVLGISLAIYSARFVPEIVNGVGSAAVYLGSAFTPDDEPSLSVVPPTTTIPFPTPTPVATPTPAATTTAPAPVAPVVKPTPPVYKPPVTGTTPGTPTSGTYPIGGTATGTRPATLYGLPDLVVSIETIGYLTTSAAESFVASSTVPSGMRPAVKFVVRNIGTNATGAWRFSASIPTQTSYIYQSQSQQSLLPGDSITYTLGFDQANRGTNQMVSVTVNFDRMVGESNINNNSASTNLTIMGG